MKVASKRPENLQYLFAQSPVALAFFEGPDLIVDSANELMLDFMGRDEKIIGKPLLQAIPELKDQDFPDLLIQVYESGKEYKGFEKAVLIFKNGQLESGFFDFIYTPIRNEEGVIIGVGAIATDVSEKVFSKIQLESSESKFRGLVLNADIATAIYTGPEMTISLANDAMIEVWGKDESVIGKTLREALPELDGQPFHDLLHNVYTTGHTYKATEDRVDLVVDGTLQTFYYNFSYKVLRNPNGEIYGILNMAVNVTELVESRKRLEQSRKAMQQNEKQLREMANSMPQQVWTATADGKIKFVNLVACEYYGVDEDEIIGTTWEEFMHPDDLPTTMETWVNALKNKHRYEVEFRLLDKDGNSKYFLSRAVPVLDENGQIEKWIGTNTDINEFKILQRQKDDFIGIASHELKTPVTSIKAYTQVLEHMLRKEGDEYKADLLQKMDNQLNKFNVLISDLLDVTKIQTGRMQFNSDFFDFNELVTEIVGEVRPTTSKHEIVLKSSTVPAIYADRDRIGQVITNLLTNAIKYSPDAEKIVVFTKTQNNEVHLCVQDFGIGIPNDKKNQVFQQFYRVSGTKEHTFPGIGLGLYICSQIIEREGGEIWVNSKEGEGSTFCFSLPIERIQDLRSTKKSKVK